MADKIRMIRFVVKHYRSLMKFRKLPSRQQRDSQLPEHFVRDLIDMGPTFVKLGQILSTRPDILPEPYIRALARLQEKVPPFSFSGVKQILEKEFGKPLPEIFPVFEEVPAASASLAQVHFANLPSGEPVAVKIQRPGARERVRRDMAAIEQLIRIARLFSPGRVRRANLLNGFLEFKRYTLQELDFHNEGETIARFAANFEDWDDIIFPRVFREYTTEKILTMEKVDGLRLGEVISALSPDRRQRLNTRIAEMELKMFISDALFHADLHPGNIFFQEDGKIVLLDFGMYGELTPEERDYFVLYWLAVVQNDVKRAFYYFKKQCTELRGADEDSFYAVFKDLAHQFYNTRLIDTSITKVYLNMITAGYRYGYVFPSNLLLHAKALTTAEALTFALAPDARFEEITKPLIAKEFSKIAVSRGRLRHRIEKSLPGLLLSGELLSNAEAGVDPLPDYDAKPFWTALYDQLLENFRSWQAHAGAFRAILNDPAEKVLTKHGWREDIIEQTLNTVWEHYLELEPPLAKQQTLGATFTLHLGAATIAMFKALVSAGKDKAAATELIYEIGWNVYSRMAEWPLLIGGIFADDPYKKMEIATRVFRKFPFTEPDYGWDEVKAGPDTVAFNCTRCHVAELFKQHGLADVCYKTWCSLDFPLARQWGGWLERTNSIAGGAEICDFRWKVRKTEGISD